MPRPRWTGPVLLALLLTVLTPLPSAAADPAPPPKETTKAAPSVPLPSLRATTTQVASGLRRPTAIAAPDDGTDRLFITREARHRTRLPPGHRPRGRPRSSTSRQSVDESGNERGLLGIALAPNFAQSQDLYLAYTACRTAR